MEVYFREKHLSKRGEASTHNDLQLKGPARLALSTRKTKFKTLYTSLVKPLIKNLNHICEPYLNAKKIGTLLEENK